MDSSNFDNKTILEIQENDRHRIARDLHDSPLQNLAHLVHKIELASMYIDKDPVRAKLELSVVNKNLRNVMDDIRSTIFDLRPMTFDDLGLKAALERLLETINENMVYELDVDIDDVSCETNLVSVNIYRIVQECLVNIVKHAEASKILFHFKEMDSYYKIVIEDNGKGFDREEVAAKKENHFGLSLLKERVSLLNGNVEVHSEMEIGTRIEVSIPITDR